MVALLSALLLVLPALPGQAEPVSRADLGRKALSIVAAQLKSDDSDLRAQAAEILGATGNKAAIPMMQRLLTDRDKYVRIAAARALWELGSPAGIKTIYAIINDIPAQGTVPVTNSPLVELKVISQNKVRTKAMEALVAMKGKDASDVLYKMKNDNYGTVRDAAAKELAKLGNEDELVQFTEALASEDEALRYESAVVMSKLCVSEAADPLRALLPAEKSVRVLMAALDALKCNPSKKDALSEVLKLADSPNPTIKYKAVAVLSGIKDPKAQDKLSAMASDASSDIRLKITAQKGLMFNGAPAAIEVAQSALSAVSPEVKLEALDVIEGFSEDEAAPLLAQALDDTSVQVTLASSLQVLKRFARK
jgi:HEAT repeat protein